MQLPTSRFVSSTCVLAVLSACAQVPFATAIRQAASPHIAPRRLLRNGRSDSHEAMTDAAFGLQPDADLHSNLPIVNLIQDHNDVASNVSAFLTEEVVMNVATSTTLELAVTEATAMNASSLSIDEELAITEATVAGNVSFPSGDSLLDDDFTTPEAAAIQTSITGNSSDLVAIAVWEPWSAANTTTAIFANTALGPMWRFFEDSSVALKSLPMDGTHALLVALFACFPFLLVATTAAVLLLVDRWFPEEPAPLHGRFQRRSTQNTMRDLTIEARAPWDILQETRRDTAPKLWSASKAA